MENGTNLPNGWEWTTIAEVTKPISKVNPAENPNKDFFYLDISSIDNSIQQIVSPKKYIGSDAPSRARQLVRAGDVLFSTVRTYLKNIALVPDIYDNQVASTGFSILRANPATNGKYLFYYCLTDSFLTPLNDLQRGTSYPAVRDSDVREQAIPLPPLPEQERIVARIESLFTQLDAGVSALKLARAALKRYKASVLKAACEGRLVAQDPSDEPAEEVLKRILAERGEKFVPPEGELAELPRGWCWAKWEQIVLLSQNGFGKRKSDTGNPTIVLRLADVVGNHIFLDSIRRIGATSEEVSKYQLHENDIICVRVNGSLDNVGRMILFQNYSEPVTFCDHFIRFRLIDPELAPFLTIYFNSDRARKYIELNRVSSAGQNTISQGTLLNFVLPIPPKVEQHRIIAEVERRLSVVKELEGTIEANLRRAGRLRQAILKRAFEGRL